MLNRYLFEAMRRQRLVVRMRLGLHPDRPKRANVDASFYTCVDREGVLTFGRMDYTYAIIDGRPWVESHAEFGGERDLRSWVHHQAVRLSDDPLWYVDGDFVCYYAYLTGPGCMLNPHEDAYLRTHLARAQALATAEAHWDASETHGILLRAMHNRLDGLLHELIPMPNYPRN